MTITTDDATSASRGSRLGHLLARGAALGLAAVLAASAVPLVGAGSAAHAAPAAPAAGDWVGNAPNSTGGTDYFLDATAGDDAASGTSRATAWKTLAKASATTFAPGDRVLLKAGETWSDQQLWPKGDGADGRPIVVGAYGDAERRPYIATNGVVQSPFTSTGAKDPETVGLTGAVNLRNQQYWEITQLEVSNDDDFATDITTGSFVRDGISVSINADLLAPGADTVMDHIRVTDVFAHDIDGPSSWQKIHYGGINFQVFGSKEYTEYAPGGHHFRDVRIEGNRFERVELHAVQFAFNWFGASQGQTDEAGKYHEGWEQLWVRTRDLYSRDVYIGHNYAESIGQGPYQFANAEDMLVEYNEANGWLERYTQVSAGLYAWASSDVLMRYNEIYGGPANQYDATPWDLEFTNFDVTYEYNYSHDNEGGWMAYMGNSSNSIARYNLSVNDNGVIWKNMLSSNYSPTYVLNNVFVYDGAQLDSFHDEVLKDRVYFANNVFYNTSTTPTTWYTKPGALDRGVFSNNVYYETGGVQSSTRPVDDAAITVDPQFVGDPADYARAAGVDQVVTSASLFDLQPTSPLIDAGRYNPRVGDADFGGTPIWFGDAVDVGLDEVRQGAQETAPVDTDPIEDEGVDTRPDLALGKPVTASSTNPHQNFSLSGDKITDGDPATRWAAADDATWPVTVEVDFGANVTFTEVSVQEFTDAGTPARVRGYELQAWDAATSTWRTVTSAEDGIGPTRVLTGFGEVTTSRLRFAMTSLLPGQSGGPTLTGLQVRGVTAEVGDPAVTPGAAVRDVAAARVDDPTNTVTFTVDPAGSTLTGVRYVQPSGAVVGSLDEADRTITETADGVTVTLTPAFFADKELGTSGLVFEFASDRTVRTSIDLVDSTGLATAIAEAEAVPATGTEQRAALTDATEVAQGVLARLTGTATGSTTDAVVQQAAADLRAAIAAYQADPGTPVAPPTTPVTPPGTPGGPDAPGAGGPTTGGGTTAAGGGTTTAGTGTSATGRDGDLAWTGSDGLPWAVGGAALLLLGALLVGGTAARRRPDAR